MHPNEYIFPCFLHCTAAAPAASCVWPDRYCVIGCAVWTCKGVVYWMIDLEKVEICDLNRFYLHVQVFCSESSGLYCHLKGACLSFWKFWQMQMQKGGKADQLSFPACCEEKTYSMSICVVLGQWRNWSEWRARVKKAQRDLDIYQTSLDLLSDWQPTNDAANACSNATRLTRV